ncbi:SusC/RagA family TonB-linked outer membrane protein [Chryseobacterium sp. Leaf404]|uniref:SusC/RagA family TonB-linked outer membrane protein n=1 Tax=unclassified Chryseobacterium TaxID=2593645 RepID=UPI0006F92354|nr:MULTISPECIES: SusC/RagA family TonB-linked outer membrane protein [unclassified Chryseobacterium]KQT21789.1 SusC/RagA family TonB-linked outer membrane protein [Chryseobacterium sp. Leaf404]
MSIKVKHRNFKPLMAPLFLLATGFMFGQQAVNDTVKQGTTKDIEEVVVIGYGKVKKSDLTGSVASVSAKELAATPAMNALQALQGRAAGLNIVTAGGAPGAGANVTIRGGASITSGTTPLYIVDGFQLDNALNIINPNDIESIDILKGPSAIAIYGARGSNGIIIIKTKSGKKGRTVINYNSFMAFDMLSKRIDMISNSEQFVKYQYEMAQLQGKTTQWSNVFDNSLGTDTPGFYTGVFNRISNRYGSSNALDWQEKMLGSTGMTQNHNVNFSTGNEKTQAFVSYNYNKQDGLLQNYSETRNSLRANINSELKKGFRVDFSTMFTSNSTNGGGAYSGIKKILLQPITGGTLFTDDELYNTQTFPDFSSLDSGYDTENPFVETNASTSNNRSRTFLANMGLEIDFLKNFTFRTAGQYQWSNSKSTSFSDENSRAFLTDPVNTGINGSIGNSESYRYQITNTVNYTNTFGEKHKVSALAGQEAVFSQSESNSMRLIKFPIANSGLDDIRNATVQDKSAGRGTPNTLLSYFGRVNYTYDDRYLVTGTLRYDGSSKFGIGKKWGLFPSAAVAWRLSQENFWQNSKISNVINDLKFRYEYGVTGNNDVDSNIFFTNIVQTDYPINNTPGNPAYVPGTNLGNPNASWEESQNSNLGMDLALFNNRIKLTAELYDNKVAGMLLNSIYPVSSGYSRRVENIGSMTNRGMEFTLNTVNFKNAGFRWTTDLNFSANRSEVLSLEKNQPNKTFSVGGNRTGVVTYYATVGERLGDMYGYVYQGVYTTDDFLVNTDGSFGALKPGVVKPATGTARPGDMKFAADNDKGDQFTRKLQKIGNGTPDFFGGFQNNFSYKGFDLAVFMKFSVGGDIYNATKHSLSPYALYQNVPGEFGDNYYRLIDPNTGQITNNIQRLKELNPDEGSRTWSLSNANSQNITYPSSYYVEDGSYLRIAQVTLGYSFEKQFLQNVGLSNARIYLTLNNLATITGYSGYDPEVSSASGVAVTPGFDNSAYPRSKSYVLGINLTF